MSRKKGGLQGGGSELPPLGLFSRPSYLSNGDPYVKKNRKPDARNVGRQLLTNPPKTGKTLDAFFEKKLTPLFRGEPFVETTAFERRERNKKNKKVLGGAWRPSNPSKKPTGPGSDVGTMSKGAPHMPDFRVPMPGDGPVLENNGKVLRNFVTNPPKKGGPGTAERFVGKPPAEYKPTPAADEAARRAKERQRELSKRLGGAFKSRVTVADSFDGGKIYEPYVPKARRTKGKKKARARTAGPLGGPWRPSSNIKDAKYDSAFGTSYPKYEPDPVDAREKRAKQREAKFRGKPLAGPFITTFKTNDDLPSKLARPVTSKW